MQIRIPLTNPTRKAGFQKLKDAYATGQLRLIKRIHAVLDIADGLSVAEVAERLNLGEQTVRDSVKAFLGKGVDSLVYKRPPGRPPASPKHNARRGSHRPSRPAASARPTKSSG